MTDKFIDLTKDNITPSSSSNNFPRVNQSSENRIQMQEPPRVFSAPFNYPSNVVIPPINTINTIPQNFNNFFLSSQTQYTNQTQPLSFQHYPNQNLPSNIPQQPQQKMRVLPSSLLAPFQQNQFQSSSSSSNPNPYYRNFENRAMINSLGNQQSASRSLPSSLPQGQYTNYINRAPNAVTSNWTQPSPPQYYSTRIVFSLIDDLEFTARAEISNGLQTIVEIFKQVPGAKFDWNIKKWIFPTSSHDVLSTALSAQKCQVETIPRTVLSAAQMKVNDKTTLNRESLELISKLVPDNYLEVLAPFQKETIVFALKKQGRILIADEMGLGKTRSALGVCIAFRSSWPVLIVCPSSARHHWQNEINNLVVPTGLVQPREVTVIDNSTHPLESSSSEFKFKFLIISYNLFNKLSHLIETMKFDIIVADESHYLKNRQAKRTKILVPLIQKSKYAILISGTPALSRPLELYCQLNALKPDIWSDYKAFGKRYCVDSKANNKKGLFNSHNRYSSWGDNVYKGANNTRELHVLLTSSVMIRRLKRNILSQLPAKKRHLVKITIEDNDKRLNFLSMLSQLSIYEELINKKDKIKRNLTSLKNTEVQLGDSDENNIKEIKKQRKNIMLTLFNESGGAKIPGAIKALDKFLQDNPNEKILIFAHHLNVLDEIQTFIQKQNIEFIRIDGSTSSLDRHKHTQTFQTDPNIKIALLGITAAGIALTLTAASVVFFIEFIWTPGALIQAEDRAHRIGQLRDVNIYYLFASDSVDEILWPFLRKKMKLIGEIVEGQNDIDLTASIFNNNNNSSLSNAENTGKSSDIIHLDIENDEELYNFVNELAQDTDNMEDILACQKHPIESKKTEDEIDEEEDDENLPTQDEDDYEAYLNKEESPDPLAVYYMENLNSKSPRINVNSENGIDYFSMKPQIGNRSHNPFRAQSSKPLTIDLIGNELSTRTEPIVLDIDEDNDKKDSSKNQEKSSLSNFFSDSSDALSTIISLDDSFNDSGKRNFTSSSILNTDTQQNAPKCSKPNCKEVEENTPSFDCDSFEFHLM